MKKYITLALIVTCAALAACGNKPEPNAGVVKPAVPASAAAKAPASKAEDAPRAATYDPNLKPAQIVWDSPEKQKAWEARQVELKKSAPHSVK